MFKRTRLRVNHEWGKEFDNKNKSVSDWFLKIKNLKIKLQANYENS